MTPFQQPPKKRKLAHEIDPLRRSELIYMEDGNIVLAAEDTAFRVYKGTLAYCSEVFADLFALATGPDSNGILFKEAEMFEGCPVVRVSDTSEQLAALLGPVYNSTRAQVSRDLGIRTLLHILLLAHKYMMDDLGNLALKALRPFFPITLESWHGCSGITPHIREAISTEDLSYAIAVARTVGCNTILPIAFFLLASRPLGELMEQIPSKQEILNVVRGREMLSSIALTQTLSALQACTLTTNTTVSHSAEMHQQASATVKTRTLLGLFTPGSRYPPQPSPYASIFRRTTRLFNVVQCLACLECARNEQARILLNIWNSIPPAFGVKLTDSETSGWSNSKFDGAQSTTIISIHY